MADTNLNKIDLYEQTIAQTDTTQIDENSQYDIKDMPVGGITNAQMTLLTQSTHLGLLPIGAVFKCIDSGTYIKGQFYKYTGTSWEVEKVLVDEATYSMSGIIKLGSNTQSTEPVETASSTPNRQYPIQADSNGRISVNVPWTDTNTTYSNGDGLNLSAQNVFSVNFNAVEKKITQETYTVASNSWTALASSEPFTYQTTITATYTIGNDTEVGIINDQAVLFANYGFIVGSVSGQSVTIYSIAQPNTSVTLKVGYRG